MEGWVMQEIHSYWDGPYSWPGFEGENRLSWLPKIAGVYLQTFEYQNGYLIYCAGLTRRPAPVRFKEHARNYMNGEYTVLDVDAARRGVRREIWHGWGYARAHRDEFEERKIEIQSAVKRQLTDFRLFISKLDASGRILERAEASIMNHLSQQKPPYCTIPDKGMMLAPRWREEPPLLMVNHSQVKLHALHNVIEI